MTIKKGSKLAKAISIFTVLSIIILCQTTSFATDKSANDVHDANVQKVQKVLDNLNAEFAGEGSFKITDKNDSRFDSIKDADLSKIATELEGIVAKGTEIQGYLDNLKKERALMNTGEANEIEPSTDGSQTKTTYLGAALWVNERVDYSYTYGTPSGYTGSYYYFTDFNQLTVWFSGLTMGWGVVVVGKPTVDIHQYSGLGRNAMVVTYDAYVSFGGAGSGGGSISLPISWSSGTSTHTVYLAGT